MISLRRLARCESMILQGLQVLKRMGTLIDMGILNARYVSVNLVHTTLSAESSSWVSKHR